MEQRILNYWKGCVQIQITGNSYDRFLNLCAYHGIRLRNLTVSGNSYTVYLSRSDFKKLKSIVKKSHVRVCIMQKHGFPFFLHKYRKRKIGAAGIAAAMLFMLWLSSHIWNITIDGNLSQTDDILFEYLTQEGICYGMPKAQIDCKDLASEMRNYFTQFSWVAAELRGTRLIIHVKEGIPDDDAGNSSSEKHAVQEPLEEAETEKKPYSAANAPTDLVASGSGTIDSIYVRSGKAMVAVGDEVEEGTVLVSGLLPILDDSGSIVSWQQVNADADIIIRRNQTYRDQVIIAHTEKIYTGKEKKRYLVRIGTSVFSLPDRFDLLKSYDLFSELTQFRLMENFYLPLYVQKFTAKEYENREILYTKEQAVEILNENFQYFMKNLEEKGVQIFENDVKIEWNEKSAIANGTVWLGEPAYVRARSVETTKEELLKQ